MLDFADGGGALDDGDAEACGEAGTEELEMKSEGVEAPIDEDVALAGIQIVLVTTTVTTL
jgi:hypothetical protein